MHRSNLKLGAMLFQDLDHIMVLVMQCVCQRRAAPLVLGDGIRPTLEEQLDDLEDAAALQGIANVPARVKCAVLAWHTLEEALDGEGTIESK